MGMGGGGVAGTEALGDRKPGIPEGGKRSSISKLQVRERSADGSEWRGRAIVWRLLCPKEGAGRGGQAIVFNTQLGLPALVGQEEEAWEALGKGLKGTGLGGQKEGWRLWG